MNKIRILPENLANQIAAGEVVERPASVIKELVENSIDAGAQRIRVEIELGGRRLMRISDDGRGMNSEDAVLAFERHATSKIIKLEDLDRIETLGFRGEALASISSVAKVDLITNDLESKAATRILIEGGTLIDIGENAHPTGTTVTVRDLFFNTPARRKFMRSHATENYHVTNTVTHYALANPSISFSLTNNGRETIRVASAKSLKERAYQLFGSELIESLIPVDGGRQYIANVSGFVSAPRERRTTRDSQYFFINGRFVKDKIISGGLHEGFRSVLPHGVHPIAFLFIDIPHEEIDVNVHPAKTEVRFRRARAVKDVVAEAVRKSLTSAGIIDKHRDRAGSDQYRERLSGLDDGFKKKEEPGAVQVAEVQNRAADAPQAVSEFEYKIPVSSADFEASALDRGGQIESPAANDTAASSTGDYKFLPPVDSAASVPVAIEIEDISPGKISPIGQLHESFIVAADDEGLLLIDQHVAHERILFDKFRKIESERTLESQNLLIPETIDLTPAQSAAFDEIKDELKRYGFGLIMLSGRTVGITAVPTDLPRHEVKNLFSEILDTVEKDKKGSAKATLRDDIAASLACKAAVKINMKLTPEKMQWMIDKLLTTSSPTTCPHGRPVILRLTMKDIERKFHRT